MLKPVYIPCLLTVGGLLHETVFQTFSSHVAINFSGAQYDKIAVDVEKGSIYKTDIHLHDN